MSDEADRGEEDPCEFPLREGKDNRYFLIRGDPPNTHSKFSIPAKRPKWPRSLWKRKVLIYDIKDPEKSLKPPNTSSDRLLRFDSKFESGNLSKVYLLGPETYHCLIERDPNASGSCQWFYFKITNTRKDMNYRFYISGFHKASSLYCSGAKVFWYSTKAAIETNVSWKRGGTRYAYTVTLRPKNKRKRASLQFQITFPYDNDEVCLCYAIPYTYTDLVRSIGRWTSIAKPGWMTVERLCVTEGGRDCPVLTITNPDVSDAQKKCVFITGRIHPGESNSSFMVHGIIDFFLSGTPEANTILEKAIVKCVPMMNIDGVIAGFYRVSLHECDLNRVWTEPDDEVHPVVYYTKKLIKEIVKERELAIYLDFHGHSRLHGTFAYACPTDDFLKEKIYPRTLAYLCDAFAWNHCAFSLPKEREAAGRVVVASEMGIVNSFTIESSFGGITAGPRAGLLYDELLWKEIGAQCGVAIYHMMSGTSEIVEFVEKELSSFLPVSSIITSQESDDCVKFVDEEDRFGESTQDKRSVNIFHFVQQGRSLVSDPSEIQYSATALRRPHWLENQFQIG